MKRIAAITMVRGDAFYLRKWTAWYGGQLGEENLYILITMTAGDIFNNFVIYQD